MKRDDIEDLDDEIESAVDSLFVEEGADREIGLGGREGGIPEQAESIPDISPEVMEESLAKAELGETILEAEPIMDEMVFSTEETESIVEETVSSAEETEPIEKPLEEEKLPKAIETLEVEVLSLEWEFSGETLKKIIAALGGLKTAYRDDNSLLKVIDMMGKVSLYLLNDEKSITPEALRFLQDGKEVVKFLITDKGEQVIFKNLMVEGINSHFQLLGLGKEARRDKDRDKIFQKLCSDLEKYRMSLCDGEDRLGRALHRVKGMNEELIFDNGIKGLSDELEKIKGYLRSYLGRLDDISEQFQREIFGQRLYETERVLLVETQNRIFGIPSDSVIKTYALTDGYAKSISLKDSITLKGKRIPMVKLSNVFNLAMTGVRKPQGIVLVKKRDQIIAILVDKVLRNKNLFVKTAGQEREELKYIAAISHLESGKMVYILNIDRLKARTQT
ncbi:MAG: chemotaxis protein CheW [Syntrophobacterales bacterium]|nr:MAG: chemotaxis protein CheW [Syntrophobacterales bacterium]